MQKIAQKEIGSLRHSPAHEMSSRNPNHRALPSPCQSDAATYTQKTMTNPLFKTATRCLMMVYVLSSNVNMVAGFTPLSNKCGQRNHHHYTRTNPIHNGQYSTATFLPNGLITRNTKLPSMLTASTEQENNTTQGPSSPAQPDEMIEKFKSYATNIIRTRKITKEIKVKRQSHESEIEIQLQMSSKPARESMSAIRSLLYTLKSESLALTQEAANTNRNINEYILSEDVMADLRENMNRALIQATRAASDHGDYIMISNILDVAIAYAEAVTKVYRVGSEDGGKCPALLEARLFGEALSELSRTKANHSKLKKLWSLFIDLSSNSERCILASQPSAFELNAMILGLGSKGKFRAALKLYVEYNTKNGTNGVEIDNDEYTASALLTILANSIASDALPDTNITSVAGGNSRRSPCWQWNEAESILDDFENRMQLNNQVYASALKVNEQAMELYKYPGNRHPGAKYAMSILERMQVSYCDIQYVIRELLFLCSI